MISIQMGEVWLEVGTLNPRHLQLISFTGAPAISLQHVIGYVRTVRHTNLEKPDGNGGFPNPKDLDSSKGF